MNPGAVAIILADAARHGITLQAYAGKVRFRPRSAMTPDLAERIKTHRPALLALLSGPEIPETDTTPPADDTSGPDDAASGVSSVVSVSDRDKALWSEDELAMLARAGSTPADLPLVPAVKDSFAEFGATVVSIESAHACGERTRSETRTRVAELIRCARIRSVGEAVAMRDAWAERLAICTIDGGQSDDRAKEVALAELEENFPLG